MPGCVEAVAPGKVIWFGEHFVVLGRPAIAGAVGLYARARLCRGKGLRVMSRELGAVLSDNHVDEAMRPFARILELARDMGFDTRVEGFISSEIPVGAGMGSSAASAAAFAAALLALNDAFTRELVGRLSHEAEKIVHGRPSGIDTTVSVYGGFVFFRKDRGFERIDARLPGDTLVLAVDTGVPRSTGVAVELVLGRYERWRGVMERIYGAAEALVLEARGALERGDAAALGELMSINHGLLVSLGVAIPETEAVVHTALRAGALGAKITGAGLGGLVLVLTDTRRSPHVIEALSGVAEKIIPLQPDYNGVIVKHIS